jgi:hypothetical protein
MEPSSLDKLIRGIWEQLHGSLSFDLKDVVSLRSSYCDFLQPPILIDDGRLTSGMRLGKSAFLA